MKTVALSGWLAYVPFRAAEPELQKLGVKLADGAHDRVEGLRDGQYAATPLSTYHLVESLDLLKEDIGVSWLCVKPVGCGSDRIVVRCGIKSIEDLYKSRIGLCSQGLEINLFEHLFDMKNLPPKRDYILLPNRSAYLPAFRDGKIDAVMAPQPTRSQLLQVVPDTEVFEGDKDLPRFGIYAILAFKRRDWDSGLLEQVQNIVWNKAIQLTTLDNAQLKKVHPGSFEGIDLPAEEVKATIQWVSPEESNKYLRGTGNDSFMEHLRQVASLRERRFDTSQLRPERLNSLII